MFNASDYYRWHYKSRTNHDGTETVLRTRVYDHPNLRVVWSDEIETLDGIVYSARQTTPAPLGTDKSIYRLIMQGEPAPSYTIRVEVTPYETVVVDPSRFPTGWLARRIRDVWAGHVWLTEEQYLSPTGVWELDYEESSLLVGFSELEVHFRPYSF